jgi:hypothetical protein
VTADADAQQAVEMSDRFNHLFLRTLRQLRDLRRCIAPVRVNNPQQVNIATEGGQQVNVQKRVGRRAKKLKKSRWL